ncbi:mitochondrial intermediate peptidase [Anopheles cruzii]|uniref:mitochondrial intermediate peptidase n=1 Tax=Anopheles cruzii TaxID=68878 RepID=UPI0022EC950A|nr:mitochondrial intermediate peptidase [Anopheles cruzii]
MLRRINPIPFVLRPYRTVSTWSPLTTAFNTRPEKRINFTRNEVGLFGVAELTSYEGFYALKEKAILKTDELIDEATSADRARKMVTIFDELSDTLCKVADMSEFIRLAHPAGNFCHAAEDACISISGIVEKLNTHKPLYRALKAVVDGGDRMETSDVDKHVASLFLFDFEQCGIHLREADRQRVVYLNDCILQLGQRFMAGAVHPRRISKNVLPEAIRPFFSADGENILVSGLYADSANSMAREAAYRQFLYPDAQQEHLLSEMLKARQQLATVCGFPTYAHRALKASTMETPEMVGEFLQTLNEQLRPRAEKDFEVMRKMKAAESPGMGNNPASPLAPWDTPYFTSSLKRTYLQANASEFSPYFSLGACMEGLNLLTNALFGITLRNTEMEPGESWSHDIYKLAVMHESEGLLGYIYCDLFERQGKPNQDCHFTIQGGKVLPDGSYQHPIVVVMLNLAQPRWSGPTLLTPSMVDNLFHEMGHAMHSMLARTEYQHVTGTRCSTDFAEVPSVLMEYFASDPRVLRSFAKHFQTQEPMPEAMLERLCASKHLFAASEAQLQVFYSALDQVYHGPASGWHDRGSTTETLRTVQEQYYGLPYVENTAWQLRFSHLVGYGAKYYSYLISRAIASWIWQSYFERDPFSRTAGEKYRRGCLAYGGGIPSRLLVSNFLGREVTATNLTNSLINEIDSCGDRLQQHGGGGSR